MTSASFATGIWGSGIEGAALDVWTTTAASSVQHATNVVITSVSIANQSVTLSGTISSVIPGDIIYFYGARTSTGWNECPGLYSILVNSGNSININAANYDLWYAQYYPVNGNLSLTAIMNAAALGLSFGLEKAVLLVAPTKFAPACFFTKLL